MDTDLLKRKSARFVLWAPGQTTPKLVIGTLQFGAPPTLAGKQVVSLKPAGVSGLWDLAPADFGLAPDRVYHYWFEVDDTSPGRAPNARVAVTDPVCATVDWRLTAGGDQPASVVKFTAGMLAPCDPDGTEVVPPAAGDLRRLAANNFMVIYELPTAWARKPRGGGAERGVGTFRDIVAMLDPNAQSPDFDELEAAQKGRAHIAELGINGIELLPPADSFYQREWGYGTSHMFAPDYELGHPDFNSWPTANADLRRLAETCHGLGIRIIDDVVMGFARSGSYEHIDFDEFHIAFDHAHPPADPDAWTSRPNEARNDYGARLWRYVKTASTYDPMTGNLATFRPARHLHFLALHRWMTDFHIDGFRIDSVETVANWDFLGDFTKYAREHFRSRCSQQGMSDTEADARFLVVGEELQQPIDLIRQGRVTALWNDKFRDYLRSAVLGQNAGGEGTFEWTVRKAIDCRNFGFSDGAEAVNYIGSHDVEGMHKERIATMFRYQFPDDNDAIGRRVKLAFACLLTAVGIPMILAGDEFADENDLFNIKGSVTNDGGKQIDPVDFSRLEGEDNEWRRQVLAQVKRLIALRKSHPALGVNDTRWLHMDFTPGRRIMVWQRGGDDNPVVVVANFSDFQTPDAFNGVSEYRIPNWPRPADFLWTEVAQGREVPPEWVAREPLFAWEAKVYAHR